MRQFKTLWQTFRTGKKRHVLTGATLCAVMLAVPSAAQQRNDDRAARCQDLERQLVSDWQRNNSPQEAVGRIDQQLDELQRNRRTAEAEAERRNCYEDMFLFGRSLRRTRDCIQLDSDIENFRRNISNLRQQREAMTSSANRRVRREDLVAELARNGCGENYAREYEFAPAVDVVLLAVGRRGQLLRSRLRQHAAGRPIQSALCILSHDVRKDMRRVLFPHQLLDARKPFSRR